MNRALAMLCMVAFVAGCADQMGYGPTWRHERHTLSQQVLNDGKALVEIVRVARIHNEGYNISSTLEYVVHNRMQQPLCFAVILKDVVADKGYADGQPVVIQPGQSGIVASASATAGTQLLARIDEWDYFWTDDTTECVI